MKNIKNYVLENEKILKEWKTKKNYREEQFARDGIMFKGEFYFDGQNWRRQNGNENQMWSEAPLRILYITKDQNVGKEEDGRLGDAWDVRGETYHYPDREIMPEQNVLFRKYAFHRNLVYTLYGLLENKPEKDMIEYNNIIDSEALKVSDDNPFARINVKKLAGSSSISNNVLRGYLEQDRDIILRQIDSLDADIMVCCGYSESLDKNGSSGNLLLDFLIENGYEFKCIEPNWVYYDKKKNKIAINTWHLSARLSSEFYYSEMIGAYRKFLKKYPDFVKSHR